MMRIILAAIAFVMLATPSWGEIINDLIVREGIFYKKFTDVPFSGEVFGVQQGRLENGLRIGTWKFYSPESGQLLQKQDYKDGVKDGEYIGFWPSGQLFRKGHYKNGLKSGNWEAYYSNGQLAFKGSYKNDKKEGKWIRHKEDGTIVPERSGMFKNGEKISD